MGASAARGDALSDSPTKPTKAPGTTAPWSRQSRPLSTPAACLLDQAASSSPSIELSDDGRRHTLASLLLSVYPGLNLQPATLGPEHNSTPPDGRLTP
ncbi:hypothetical protein PtA15_2A41 [Puccinia triticina]|uniref:Uncharacterized protein n=1 Tax=Puccinia triticina TaxID=208348 RepID=A0ABY7C989_9BASI|nr:uncharacterized protein PtA15_2A41 [Puccinia triticina]WAQ81730.1 hypothetical protein PtA15_2A41 [Puccinia triticina]WAR52617.1 hypothetical protein PtB15_2B41 [Puccinia triticina]